MAGGRGFTTSGSGCARISGRGTSMPDRLATEARHIDLQSLATHAIAGGARQHAVFGRDPAAAGVAHPARHLFLKAGGAENMRVAQANRG